MSCTGWRAWSSQQLRWPQLADKQEFLPPSGSASACPGLSAKPTPQPPALLSLEVLICYPNFKYHLCGADSHGYVALTFPRTLTSSFTIGLAPDSPVKSKISLDPPLQTGSGSVPSSQDTSAPNGPGLPCCLCEPPPSWAFTAHPLVCYVWSSLRWRKPPEHLGLHCVCFLHVSGMSPGK